MNELKYHLENVNEILTYIFHYAPNFPPRDKTSIDENFDELFGHIDWLISNAEESDAKRWLNICRDEVQSSFNNYKLGESNKGKSKIRSAKDYFNNYLKGKKTHPTFSVSPNGSVTDNEDTTKK